MIEKPTNYSRNTWLGAPRNAVEISEVQEPKMTSCFIGSPLAFGEVEKCLSFLPLPYDVEGLFEEISLRSGLELRLFLSEGDYLGEM